MIDLDVIDAKCNEYLNSIGRSCGTILDVNEIKELVAYARQAEKDAARYRWLRDSEISAVGGVAIEMDKKIDEAMQCNK